MKKTLPSVRLKLRYSVLIASCCASLLATTGCGVVKAREDRTAVLNQSPGTQQGGTAGGTANPSGSTDPQEEEEIRQIKEFLDLYSNNGAVTRVDLGNFLEKYKTQIGPFLAGLHLTSQQLIDLIFQFDANHDGRVTPKEVSDGLLQHVPILRWIPDNQSEITRAQLDAQIVQEYPAAGVVARTGLADTLMRFDEVFAEGNGNGKISRSEVSGAGIILGVLAQTDFSKGFTIPAGAVAPITGGPTGSGAATIDISPVVGKMIQQKIDQQLFTRYAAQSSLQLTADDQRLEWMQLALKFFLADKLVHHFAPTDGAHAGELAESMADDALKAWGDPQPANGSMLRKYYDSAMMGGDGDGFYGSLEMFNYLTDLEFAGELRGVFQGDFSAKALTANPQKSVILATLFDLFPRTGQALFLDDLDPKQLAVWGVRTEYWDNFIQFDETAIGGNGDGAIDEGETAMGLLHAKLIENLYELFDTNHDTYLVRSEGNKLFAALGITDSRVIDAFYADVGLDSSSPTFWQKLRIFFEGDHGWHYLRPYDFHVRLVQVLPRLINPGDR